MGDKRKAGAIKRPGKPTGYTEEGLGMGKAAAETRKERAKPRKKDKSWRGPELRGPGSQGR